MSIIHLSSCNPGYLHLKISISQDYSTHIRVSDWVGCSGITLSQYHTCLIGPRCSLYFIPAITASDEVRSPEISENNCCHPTFIWEYAHLFRSAPARVVCRMLLDIVKRFEHPFSLRTALPRLSSIRALRRSFMVSDFRDSPMFHSIHDRDMGHGPWYLGITE